MTLICETGRRRNCALIAAALLLMTVAAAAAGPPVLQSRWVSSPAAAPAPAGPAFTAIGPEGTFQIALSNNATQLHMTLRVTDDDARLLLLSSGFIVWLDPAGGQHQAFGVEFPLEPRPPARPLSKGQAAKPEQKGQARSPLGTPYFDPGQLLDHEQKSGRLDRLAILTGKGPGRILRRSDVPGIRVSIGNEAGVLTYTLDVPLTPAEDRLYAIDARPGAVIGLGLATPEGRQVLLGPPPGPLSGEPGGAGPWLPGEQVQPPEQTRGPESGEGAVRGRIRDWTTARLAVR